MGESKIEWTNATWNPVRGCSLVSAGCTNCYAMRQAHRQKNGAYKGLTRLGASGPVWTGDVRLVPEAIDYPARLKKPHMIFVNSMSDLFHEGVGDAAILRVFSQMAWANHHTYQILTKRPERMAHILPWVGRKFQEEDITWPLPNVWLGVSAENQETANERLPLLFQTPAAVRWLSAEPLLGPIDLAQAGLEIRMHDLDSPDEVNLDWVVVGGESGQRARPMDVAWAYSIVQQCQGADVPVFVKQLGAKPVSAQISGDFPVAATRYDGNLWRWLLDDSKGGNPAEWPLDLRVRQFPDRLAA